MDSIKINTTQNVALSYTAAGVGPRILAGLLDLVFVYAYAIIIITVFTFAINKNRYSNTYESNENYDQLMIGIAILCLLPALLYHLLCETFLNGQSFGKKIMKIKVVKINGTQPNFGSYLIRSMFRLIDISLISPVVALITIAVSKNSQRFGDMVAGTTLIELNKKLTINDTILYQQKPDYKIIYNQVALMNDADANTIKDVLEFSFRQNQPQHLTLLAQKIKTKYAISDVSQKDDIFLRTLLMDYSHYLFEK